MPVMHLGLATPRLRQRVSRWSLMSVRGSEGVVRHVIVVWRGPTGQRGFRSKLLRPGLWKYVGMSSLGQELTERW
jgi:hypothetical protein